MWRWSVIAAVAVASVAATAPGSSLQPTPAAKPKDLSLWSIDGADGAKVTQAVVRIGPGGTCPTFTLGKQSAMIRRVEAEDRGGGVVALLETKDIRMLDAMTPRKTEAIGGVAPDKNAERLYSVTLCDGTKAEVIRRVDLVMSPDGSVWAKGDGGKTQPLDREKFLTLSEAWPWYGGTFDRPASSDGKPSAARVEELAHPYVAGRYILDQEGISKRMLGGRPSQLDRADRVLEIEKLHVRAPVGYSPREPAGLLVWIDADDECHLPGALFAALDESNIVIAGFDKCGNTRPVANRYQLALDAVATVSRRYHIDKRRVYISGISGGGRVASIVQGCFPDIFTGAIPIVGLSCFDNVPVGSGRHAPAAYSPPRGKLMDLLKQRRVAAITGGKDFNHTEILAAAQVMRGEGLQAKVYETQEQGHEIPKPALFADALKWVDEPWRKIRKTEVDAGEKEWEGKGKAIREKGKDGKPVTDEDRAALRHITESAPWTPAAWRAVELLEQYK